MSPRLFVLSRSILAIALMVGFYALAFGIIALLGFICYEVVLEGRFGFGALKVLVFCPLGIITIFFSVLPRREEFNQPGPQVVAEEFPDLFNEIRHITEVRSVLAHEFGHFHGGDTAIGPWIYKIRAAMARTLQGLATQSAILRKPFEWYGILFLRSTLAVSRLQEYAADRLAASIAGLAPTVSGLKKVHALAPISEAFWSQEVGPAVKKGFRPTLAEGFNAFTKTPRIAEAVPKILESVLEEEVTNPYESHPCLRDRLKALGADATEYHGAAESSPSAMELVKGYEKLEPGLFGFLLKINPNNLNPLTWEESGKKVHRPQLQEFLQPFAEKLASLDFKQYPHYFTEPAMVADSLKDIGGVPDEPEARRDFIANILEVHLILRLCTQGWTLQSRPGEPLECRPADSEAAGKALTFGTLKDGIEKKKISSEVWSEKCRSWKLN